MAGGRVIKYAKVIHINCRSLVARPCNDTGVIQWKERVAVIPSTALANVCRVEAEQYSSVTSPSPAHRAIAAVCGMMDSIADVELH